jgi:hypothetical protein
MHKQITANQRTKLTLGFIYAQKRPMKEALEDSVEIIGY